MSQQGGKDCSRGRLQLARWYVRTLCRTVNDTRAGSVGGEIARLLSAFPQFALRSTEADTTRNAGTGVLKALLTGIIGH